MGDPKLAPAERYTYRQYRSWPDTERWELIDGRAWAMSPAPKSRHQALVWRPSSLLYNFLKGKACRAYPSPFDVLLLHGGEEDDDVDTIVQPDISVFCDRSRITERGAREYWVVDPSAWSVWVYRLTPRGASTRASSRNGLGIRPPSRRPSSKAFRSIRSSCSRTWTEARRGAIISSRERQIDTI